VVEVVGGLATGSLALLADAGHVATDAAALALALGAVWLMRRPATEERSFGWLRAEVLAALTNAAALIAVSGVVLWEAARRLGDPPTVDGGPMLAVAGVGLAGNAVAAWVLFRGSGHAAGLNRRGALLHVVGDLLGSVAAIVAGAVILLTGWDLADPLLSAGIGALILWGAWRLLRDALDVLLEAAPGGLDPAEVRRAMEAAPGVVGIHDLHVWTVSSGLVALSAHVEVAVEGPGDRPWADLLPRLATLLRERFGIAHVTLQPEEAGGSAERDPFRGCTLDSPEGRAICRAGPATGEVGGA